jgi:hypothetical protein
MKSEKLALYYIAKYTNHELLIDGLVLTNQLGSWEKNSKRKRSMTLKIIRMKIFYAVIFGILPIMPLLGYFQIANFLIDSLISVEIIIFHGSLYFGLFFMLQFFNFFLMGMLETGMIMSGRIFEWFETLPINRDRLKKIVFITIFRSFDLPIIVIIMAFPIILLIGTSNVVIFIISIGISILNVLFSFNILILVGGRINRVLDVNEINSRRSYTIRLFNIISYIIITLGSMYLIQWAFSSIDIFFRLFLNIQNPEMTNIFLSSIPYPFNQSYFILNLIVSDRTPLELWFSSIIGLIIFFAITWGLYAKALQQLEKLTFSKFRSTEKKKTSKKREKEIEVKIKSLSPVKAYLRKDLVLISHDLKTFLSIVTSIILSFIYIFYFNLGSIGEITHIVSVIYTNLIGMLIFHPILSAMLVYSILSLEDSGQSLLTSLPIIPRQQAKTKLLLLFIIQTLAAFLPNLMFINDPNSSGLIIATFASLPFIWLFLMIIFLLKISFFGKISKHYVLKEVKPENKLFKWVLLLCIHFIYRNFVAMVAFMVSIGIIGLVTVIIFYSRMFPSHAKSKNLVFVRKEMIYKEKEVKPVIIHSPTILTSQTWGSIFLLLLLFFCFYQLNTYVFMSSPTFLTLPYDYFQNGLQLVYSNLVYASLLVIIVPIILGLPYGRQPIKDYLVSIGLGWIYSLVKGIMWGIFISIFIIILSMTIPIYMLNFYYDIYFFLIVLTTLTFFFWQEVLFRGIILRILLNRYSKETAIFLNTILYWFWISFLIRTSIICSIVFLFIGFINAFLTTKTNSLLTSFILSIFISIFFFNLFWY